jgi:4'-phosphopantetheinyl transferase
MNITNADFLIETPLTLPENEVILWRVDLDALGVDEPRWQRILSPDESARASRFRSPTDRQRFVAARAWLRIILASYLTTDPERLSFCYSKKEKPALGPAYVSSGITFNISHSAGVALLAFARGKEIGVDVEQLRHDFDLEAIARRFFSAHEQEQLSALPAENRFDAFFRCWTRKEAYMKATGEGLSLPLHQFDVSIAEKDLNALLSTRPDSSEAMLWSLREVPAGSSYVAALCVRGHDWKLRDWASAI